MKNPEGIQVNDELLDDEGTTWQVTHVSGNTVVATPIYHRLHRQFWCRFTYLRAMRMKAENEAYIQWEAESAAAEIRAELNIPQHLVW